DAAAKLAPVDLAVLQARLGKAKDEIEASDPKALKAKIAELQKQLVAKAPAGLTAADEIRLRSEGWNAGLAGAMKEVSRARDVRNRAIQAVNAHLEKAMASLPPIEVEATPQGIPAALAKSSPPLRAAAPKVERPAQGKASASAGDIGLPKPQLRVL